MKYHSLKIHLSSKRWKKGLKRKKEKKRINLLKKELEIIRRKFLLPEKCLQKLNEIDNNIRRKQIKEDKNHAIKVKIKGKVLLNMSENNKKEKYSQKEAKLYAKYKGNDKKLFHAFKQLINEEVERRVDLIPPETTLAKDEDSISSLIGKKSKKKVKKLHKKYNYLKIEDKLSSSVEKMRIQNNMFNKKDNKKETSIPNIEYGMTPPGSIENCDIDKKSKLKNTSEKEKIDKKGKKKLDDEFHKKTKCFNSSSSQRNENNIDASLKMIGGILEERSKKSFDTFSLADPKYAYTNSDDSDFLELVY